MRRLLLSLGIVGLVSGVLAPAPGYAQQAVNIYLGGFVERSLDARASGDITVNNLNFLSYDRNPLGPTAAFGGEWEFPLISHLDASLGLGITSKSVGSFYTNLVNADGSNIPQTVSLRIVPFTALVRFLPLPRDAPIQPYIGGGIGVFAWRYSETGEFLDANMNSFQANYVGSGAAAGPVVILGLTLQPFGGLGVGFEARYQSAVGNLPSGFANSVAADQGFPGGTQIDLGGWTYAATFKVRF
jgi:hypothetical protein